ncbi:MFS general substrate transporter [Coniophora puteana RWD-64-598 SS2]|uniref:MFS general substrate transporter n=1 Tax=Coniophora puteana (strain RWD-64-598) TaxID=741705 RepID=A0A5M3MG21_CONPW|nr:MFS general substrate transporter [Coniophora puteana RWD-64-598 SS2]EIW77870.1 MFS general substrate transporter [Coniophora puteana RWD-64-598 SS2]
MDVDTSPSSPSSVDASRYDLKRTSSTVMKGETDMLDRAGAVERLEDIDLDGVDKKHLEKVVWRKLDMLLLPMATMFFFLSFLDRGNIANAKVAGMQTSLNMSNYDYSIALTVTYIPYILTEIPSNLILRYVGPHLMLPGMVAIWGIIATLQGTVTSYGGLLACRFFLGLVEGGLPPGLTIYLATFYPREKLQLRIATYFAASSLSGAFTGLLAAAITNMDGVGNKPGWAWIFILEGLFSSAFGFLCFFILPKSPETTSILSPTERAYVVYRLKQAGSASSDENEDNFSWREVRIALKSPQVIFGTLMSVLMGITLYGLAYFEPIIVQGLGYAGNRAQLMSAPPFAVAFVLSLASAFAADRFGRRGAVAIFFACWSIVGYSIYLDETNSKHAQYGALFLAVPGTYAAAPAVMTWMANNSAPHTRRATSIALGFVASNSGGIIATWLFGTLSPAPNYTAATIVCLSSSAGVLVLAAANWVYLAKQNLDKAARREEMVTTGGSEAKGMGDKSAFFVYNL